MMFLVGYMPSTMTPYITMFDRSIDRVFGGIMVVIQWLGIFNIVMAILANSLTLIISYLPGPSRYQILVESGVLTKYRVEPW